jgi:hypothetical protein
MYNQIYAPALDNFLEGEWFQRRGLPRLLNNRTLCEKFAELLGEIRGSTDIDASAAAEAKLIWSLLRLAQSVARETGSYEDSLQDYSKRILILEVLIANGTLDSKPLPALTADDLAANDQDGIRRLEFWRLMGDFVSFPDDEASSAAAIDDTLNALQVLVGLENRDVIYSIALGRISSQRFPDVYNPAMGQDMNREKLERAKTFVEYEAIADKTTPVIRRICGLAMNLWAGPGDP